MDGTNHSEDWSALCELASKESDPRKLLDLITKINRALEECHQRKENEEALLKADTVLLRAPASRTDFDRYAFPGLLPKMPGPTTEDMSALILPARDFVHDVTAWIFVRND